MQSSRVVLQTVGSLYGVDTQERIVMQALSLIELHEHLNSSHFSGSFGIIGNSTLGCDGGTGATPCVSDGFEQQSSTLTAMECHGSVYSATSEPM